MRIEVEDYTFVGNTHEIDKWSKKLRDVDIAAKYIQPAYDVYSNQLSENYYGVYVKDTSLNDYNRYMDKRAQDIRSGRITSWS